MAVDWAEWAAVDEQLAKSKTGERPLCVVAFISDWSPAALHMAHQLDELNRSGDVHFAHLFTVNADSAEGAVEKYDISSTPALMFFWAGEPLTVRKPDWDDDVKLMGAISDESLVDVIRFARETGERGKSILLVDV
eukprot:PLAT6052.1.p4 GENE.PLAT6052.1~~PLAT6052.1.p4  ORF type:complete len:136 (+),score=45.81 PLAT6052.1:572-979(+)